MNKITDLFQQLFQECKSQNIITDEDINNILLNNSIIAPATIDNSNTQLYQSPVLDEDQISLLNDTITSYLQDINSESISFNAEAKLSYGLKIIEKDPLIIEDPPIIIEPPIVEDPVQTKSYVKPSLMSTVSYIMSNLPEGIDRVDGSVIQPLLDQCFNNLYVV